MSSRLKMGNCRHGGRRFIFIAHCITGYVPCNHWLPGFVSVSPTRTPALWAWGLCCLVQGHLPSAYNSIHEPSPSTACLNEGMDFKPQRWHLYDDVNRMRVHSVPFSQSGVPCPGHVASPRQLKDWHGLWISLPALRLNNSLVAPGSGQVSHKSGRHPKAKEFNLESSRGRWQAGSCVKFGPEKRPWRWLGRLTVTEEGHFLAGFMLFACGAGLCSGWGGRAPELGCSDGSPGSFNCWLGNLWQVAQASPCSV